MLCLLISSLLFSHLLSSSHISSADLSSCQLGSPHLSFSQRTLISSQLFSGSKPVQKTDLGAKASDPYAFHREDLTQRSFCTQQAFAQRSLCTQKLFHRDREAFTHRKLLHKASFYTQQLIAEKPSHREAFTQQAFTQRSPYTEKCVHRETFTHAKRLHREVSTVHSFCTQQVSSCKRQVLRMQPRRQATLTQSLQCDKQRRSLQNTIELRARTLAKRRLNCHFHCGADPRMIRPWPSVFRSAPVRRTSIPIHLPGHVLS